MKRYFVYSIVSSLFGARTAECNTICEVGDGKAFDMDEFKKQIMEDVRKKDPDFLPGSVTIRSMTLL